MIILGVDPGSRVTGYGVISHADGRMTYVDSGIIKTNPKHSFFERIFAVYEGLSDVVKAHQPAMAAVEKVFVGKNADSAIKLGHARGAIAVALMQVVDEVLEVTPREVKQALVGYGHADKQQVGFMVRQLLNLGDLELAEDASDALAVAAACAQVQQYQKLVKAGR